MDFRIKKIDWYITKKFMVTFFTAMLLIIGIVIIFDISEKIDDFVTKKAPFNAIVFDYYINFIPYFVNMFSPLFVFITVIFFTSRMAGNSEIIAILSCGISYHRMMRPYIFTAAVIAALSLVLNLWVIPRANATRHEFELKYTRQPKTAPEHNIHYQIAPGEFAYYESYTKWNKTCQRFTLETIRDNQIVSKLTAETATWDSTFQGWRLKKYFIRDYTDGTMGDRVRAGAQMDTVIPLTIEDFSRNRFTIEDLPYNELKQLIHMQRMRGDSDVKRSLIEQNTRFALPFSAFILTIMGVSLSSKKKRGGMGWNLAAGLALSFVYIISLRFSQMFVYTGALPPWVAIWLPNVFFGIIAVVLYRLAPK